MHAPQPRVYRYRDLIDEETGRVDTIALAAVAKARALREHGVLTPRTIRESRRFFLLNHIMPMIADWKSRHRIPQPMSTIMVPDLDGVRPEF